MYGFLKNNIEIIFIICNILVLPGWLLLIFLPKWKITRLIIYSYFIPFTLALIYLFFTVMNLVFGQRAEGGGFSSISSLKILFSRDITLLVGWVHYLAFDLFTGSWEVKDSIKNNISHFITIPCLVLTLMAGPVGLLLYLILRAVIKKKVLFDD